MLIFNSSHSPTISLRGPNEKNNPTKSPYLSNKLVFVSMFR